jgi:hypothetical protein
MPMLSYYSGFLTLRLAHVVLAGCLTVWAVKLLLQRKPRLSIPLFPAIFLYVVSNLFSVFWAENAAVVLRGTITAVISATIFYYVVNEIQSRRDIRRAINGLLIGCLILLGYALYQFAAVFSDAPDIFLHRISPYITNPYYLDIIANYNYWSRETVNYINIFPRPFSLLGDPNFLAGYAISVLPLLVALFHYGRWYKTGLLKWAAFALLLLNLAILLVTFSRSGMIALLFGMTAMVYFFAVTLPKEKSISWAKVAVTVGFLVVLIAVLLSSLIPLASYATRFATLVDLVRDPVGGDNYRISTILAGWDFFLSSPLFGIGAGNFGERYAQMHYGPDTARGQFTPITVIAETGLLGLLSLTLLVWSSLRLVLKPIFKRTKTQMSFEISVLTGLVAGYFGLLASLALYEYHNQEFVWVFVGLIVGIARHQILQEKYV